jgi:hypothetical protein
MVRKQDGIVLWGLLNKISEYEVNLYFEKLISQYRYISKQQADSTLTPRVHSLRREVKSLSSELAETRYFSSSLLGNFSLQK